MANLRCEPTPHFMPLWTLHPVSMFLEDQNEHDEKKEEQDNNHGTDYKEGIDEEVDA